MSCIPCIISELIYFVYGIIASATIALGYKFKRKLAEIFRKIFTILKELKIHGINR